MNHVQSCSADSIADIRSSLTALQTQVQEILANFNLRQQNMLNLEEGNVLSNPPLPSPKDSLTEVELEVTAEPELDLESSINSVEEFMNSETLATPRPRNLNSQLLANQQ